MYRGREAIWNITNLKNSSRCLYGIPSLKLTPHPWISMVGRWCLFFWVPAIFGGKLRVSFRGVMLLYKVVGEYSMLFVAEVLLEIFPVGTTFPCWSSLCWINNGVRPTWEWWNMPRWRWTSSLQKCLWKFRHAMETNTCFLSKAWGIRRTESQTSLRRSNRTCVLSGRKPKSFRSPGFTSRSLSFLGTVQPQD